MNTNSAFTGSFTENPFGINSSISKKTRILRRGQIIVDFDTSDNCRWYVTTMKDESNELPRLHTIDPH